MESNLNQGSLEVALSGGNFPQNGSWNMFDIAKLPVQHAVAMLSRYAASRVNPYTVMVGEAIGLTFRMGRKGRANLEEALSKLNAVNTIGNSLQIGFGVEDITRSMVKSEGGAMQMGLCAALQECYSDDNAIEVLLEYARSTKADGQWMPSNTEWRSLLDVCAGCLSASSFPRIAEHFMHLAKKSGRIGLYHKHEMEGYKGCSSPSSIAAALVALAKISTGQMVSVTFVGGPDIGWLAAFADWFLNLRIVVRYEDSNEVLFINHQEPEGFQVQMLFRNRLSWAPPPQVNATVPGGSSGRVEPSDIVAIRDKTYRIDLEDMEPNLLAGGPITHHNMAASGRVPWKTALHSVFMSEFDSLMSTPDTFGRMLGSAASIFRAVAQAHEDVPRRLTNLHGSHSDSSYGLGFVTNAISWFPELAKLRKQMEKAAKATYEQAKKEYEACLSLVRSRCACKVCKYDDSGNGFFNLSTGTRSQSSSSSSSEEEEVSRDESHCGFVSSYEQLHEEQAIKGSPFQPCLLLLAETIIGLCRSLSHVTLCSQDLLPTRKGLELAYTRAARIRSGTSFDLWDRLQPIGQIFYCMDVDDENTIRLPRNGDIDPMCKGRLLAMLELFAGRSIRMLNFDMSAVWVNGITAFLSVLTDRHSEGVDDAMQIYIAPGRISFQGKSYTRVTDRDSFGHNWAARKEFDWPADAIVVPENADAIRNALSRRSMSVREGSMDLNCFLEFRLDTTSLRIATVGSQTVSVGPLSFAKFIAYRRGCVSCTNRCQSRCAPLRGGLPPIKRTNECWCEINIHGRQIQFLTPTSSMHALLTLAYLSRARDYETYIIDQECRDCCVRKALSLDRVPDRGIIFVYCYQA